MTPGPATDARVGWRLVAAIALTLAIVGAAPAAGVARSRLQATLGPAFAALLLGALALLLAVADAVFVRRLGRPSGRQLAWIGGALAVAAAYVSVTGNADPAIRAVELVHFLEYGVITFVFHRAWQQHGRAAFALAGLAAFLAGIAEELYQWWLPARVGELRDVWLNAVAIGCALAATAGLTPPLGRARWTPQAVTLVVRLVAAVVLALAAFVHVVHLGTEVRAGAAVFASRFTAEALDRAATERRSAWAALPPLTRPDRLSREDQYATEGLQHVQARNTAWAAGDAVTAWHENQILERYFAPVLDTPSYISRTGHRWTDRQRADVEARALSSSTAPFVSTAFPYPIHRWSPFVLWGLAVVVAAALVWAGGRGAATA